MKPSKYPATLAVFFSLATLAAVTRPASAQLDGLFSQDLQVKAEARDERSRIVLLENGGETVLTHDDFNYQHPHLNGDWVVWSKQVRGAGQIERHHLPTNTTMQITHSGTNINPFVSRDGVVAWEGWDDTGWQIFLFDSLRTTKISNEAVAINPTIENGILSYATRGISGAWRAVLRRIETGEEQDVAVGNQYKKPRLEGGEILFAGAPKSPLSAENLFTLGLVSIAPPKPGDITVEDILEEIKALEATEQKEETPFQESPAAPDTQESSSSAEPEAQLPLDGSPSASPGTIE